MQGVWESMGAAVPHRYLGTDHLLQEALTLVGVIFESTKFVAFLDLHTVYRDSWPDHCNYPFAFVPKVL